VRGCQSSRAALLIRTRPRPRSSPRPNADGFSRWPVRRAGTRAPEAGLQERTASRAQQIPSPHDALIDALAREV
jgi:hypothetical protein